MFGQLGFFHKFAGKDYEDKRPRDRYVAESRRLLKVLDGRLAGRDWIMGDAYTIADIAIWPWYGGLVRNEVYHAAEFLAVGEYRHVCRWADAIAARPAVQRGRIVNTTSVLPERHTAADIDAVAWQLPPAK
jgi:GST-like protein